MRGFGYGRGRDRIHHRQELLHQKEMFGNEACAKSCIGKGAPAVLATEDGKVYAISNQDKVKDSAGKKVTVSGKMDGTTITVDTISPAKT